MNLLIYSTPIICFNTNLGFKMEKLIKLIEAQEKLCEEFERVLYENLWDLYET